MSEWTLYRILLAVFLGMAFGAFAAIRFITVPYGRHNRRGWGPQVRAYLGWMLMESPNFFVFAFFFFLAKGSVGTVELIFLALWEVHYLQRSFVYPFLMRNRQTRMPLVIVAMAMVFTTWNSYLNSRFLFHFSAGYSPEWLTDPRFLLGVTLFVAGLAINWHSDRILRRLRRPGEKTYQIPHGGFFRYVSCANYFGETVEWAGWALATWSLPGLGFAIWTVANLGPRARSHHLWYRSHFADYPKNRRAYIPFLV
jgi:3-oxo-5-alpha-steroid 4-dehydrogenase 1